MLITDIISKNLSRIRQNSYRHLSSAILTDSEYIQVPHYREKSALFIKRNLPNEKNQAVVFPRLVTPDLDLKCLFEVDNMQKSALSINLIARHCQLDLARIKKDYLEMKKLEELLIEFETEKTEVSAKANDLVKSNGKSARDTDEFKALIKQGIEIKNKINEILTELIPLQEIVHITCLRLPNNLHVSSLLVHALRSNNDFQPHFLHHDELLSEEDNSIEIFEMNEEKLLNNKSNVDWKSVLSTDKNWSFIEQSHADSVLNNKYMSGDYAKLDQALVDYVQDRLEYLNNLQTDTSVGPLFEHLKSSSMLKTVVIEGSSIYPSTSNEVINVVTFSGAHDTPSHDKQQIDLLHLTGSTSLSSMCLNFVRTKIKPKYLPWTVFSNGKAYSPKNGQTNKYQMLTLCSEPSSYIFDNTKVTKKTNILDISSILSNKGQTYLDKIRSELGEFITEFHDLRKLFSSKKNIDELIIDYLKVFVFIYKDFKIPMRFNCLNANELETNEALRIRVEAFLPSEQKYTTIGEVSLINDYLSERLQIRLDNEKKDQIKNIAMIHTTLMDINVFSQILIESNLKKTSSHSKKKFEFKLPDQLVKHYLHEETLA